MGLMLLAGDVGGTKTHLAIVTPESGAARPVAEAIFPSDDYATFEAMISVFLDQTGVQVDRASFGVAGPVVEGRAELTNLPWELEEQYLASALGVRSVHLINDLVATAYALPHLGADDICTLQPGDPVPHGTLAVVAPGTGLGLGLLTWNGMRYQPHASEGGHTDFAPRTAAQMDLLLFLQGKFDHVSFERVCSGIGLPNIYAFLKETGAFPEPAWLTEQLAAVDDINPVITAAALDPDRPCEIARATLEMFASVLAAKAANFALDVLATGGVYLAGGIPARILPALQTRSFREAFCRKGRMQDLLERVPVHVVLSSGAGLLGAAQYGLDQYVAGMEGRARTERGRVPLPA